MLFHSTESYNPRTGGVLFLFKLGWFPGFTLSRLSCVCVCVEGTCMLHIEIKTILSSWFYWIVVVHIPWKKITWDDPPTPGWESPPGWHYIVSGGPEIPISILQFLWCIETKGRIAPPLLICSSFSRKIVICHMSSIPLFLINTH